MDEKQLKTSPWQRIVIVLVAILLLGSTILTYMFIVMSGDKVQQDQENKIADLESQLTAKANELTEAAKPFSEKYLKELESYKKQVKSYNAAAANSEKIKIDDLKPGTGKQLEEGDNQYSAYYIGWCADGSIFDSSFDYAVDKDASTEDKTVYTDEIIGLKTPLINPDSLIEGWKQGVVGMKLGGVRQISIPGELAYGDTRSDICGQANAPLKFVIMALESDETLAKLNEEWNNLYLQLYAAYLGNQQ